MVRATSGAHPAGALDSALVPSDTRIARSAGTAPADVVSDAGTWRVADNGTSSLWERERTGGRQLFMTDPDVVEPANHERHTASTEDGSDESTSVASPSPTTFADHYVLAMMRFMEVPEHKRHLKDGVHYTRTLAWRSMVKPTTDDVAQQLYWALGVAGRKAFDTYTGADPAG